MGCDITIYIKYAVWYDMKNAWGMHHACKYSVKPKGQQQKHGPGFGQQNRKSNSFLGSIAVRTVLVLFWNKLLIESMGLMFIGHLPTIDEKVIDPWSTKDEPRSTWQTSQGPRVKKNELT